MCFGRRALVENVKAISWYGTGDGIMVGPDSVVRDSYGECSNGRLGCSCDSDGQPLLPTVRANDDSLKLYSSNTLWERNLIWREHSTRLPPAIFQRRSM